MPPKNKINLKDKFENGELDLSLSDLQEVPVKEIAQFKKATSLDLSNNRLTTLGKNFVILTHIIKLDLSKNLLKELPEDFGEMKQLKHLDLYSNQITHLPLSFCELKNLRWLDLKNNPLVPAVAKIVGPCLDAQQCQQSARATVQFMGEMKQQIDEEKERLKQLEQKVIEAQQEKEKQQKKRNERKKAAKAKKKEMNKKESDKDVKSNIQHREEKANHVNSKKEEEHLPKKKRVVKKKSSLPCWLVLFLTVPSILTLLFLLSASNAFGPTTEIYRTQVVSNWNDLLQKLPPQVQDYGKSFGSWIEQVHGITGIQIDNICDYLTEVSESEQAQKIKITLVETWHTVYNQSTIYLRTFVEKVSLATDEIIKKIS